MKRYKSYKKAWAISGIIAFVFLLIGCGGNSNLTPLPDYYELDDVEYLEQFGIEVSIRTSFGVSAADLVLLPDENFYGVIELANTTDPIVADLSNLSTHDVDFILKVFLNYEEVAFRVEDQETYETAYVFHLERGYRLKFEFTLPEFLVSENSTHKLTVAVFPDPNRELLTEENYHWLDWRDWALNNDLVVGSGGDIHFETPEFLELTSRAENENFIDFFVAPQFELNEWGLTASPELNMQVQRGEDIELLFYTSFRGSTRSIELENYLIIGLLNWQQVPLNGNPFLFVEALEQEFDLVRDHGSFIIDAIDEVGLYDFVVIMVHNPKHFNTIYNFFPLVTSNRLVIEVIE